VHDANVHAHLWVSLDSGSLLTNARLIRLGVDNFQQVQGIVDTSGGEALNFLGFVVSWFSVDGVKTAPSRNGAGTRGLDVLFLLWGSFLGRRACFLLGKETGSFRLASELLLALFLLLNVLILFRTLIPLGCLSLFLLTPVSQ
jgi:hypothetical protein